MSFKFCTSEAIVARAGEGVNPAAALSGSLLVQYSNEAEAYINTLTRYDWNANYANVGANFSGCLQTAASCIAAADLIAYDMSGYTSRGEAESMINILYDRALNVLKVLVDDKNKTKIGAADT